MSGDDAQRRLFGARRAIAQWHGRALTYVYLFETIRKLEPGWPLRRLCELMPARLAVRWSMLLSSVLSRPPDAAVARRPMLLRGLAQTSFDHLPFAARDAALLPIRVYFGETIARRTQPVIPVMSLATGAVGDSACA